MKKLLFGVALFTGLCFGYANDVASKIDEGQENDVKVQKITEDRNDDEDGACVRCSRTSTTTINPETGESSTTTVQFCYEVPCPPGF